MAKAKTEVKTEEVKSKGVDPGLVKNQIDGDYDFTNRMVNTAVIRFEAGEILTVVLDRDNGLYGTLRNDLDDVTFEWHAEMD